MVCMNGKLRSASLPLGVTSHAIVASSLHGNYGKAKTNVTHCFLALILNSHHYRKGVPNAHNLVAVSQMYNNSLDLATCWFALSFLMPSQ